MPPRRTWLTFLLILVVNFLLVRLLLPGTDEAIKVPYTLFKEEVAKRNVARIYSRGPSLTGRFVAPVTYPPVADSATGVRPRAVTNFATTLPAFVDPGLEALLIANGTEISAEPIPTGGSPLTTLLFGFGPALLLIGFYVWLYRRAAKQGGGLTGALTGGLGKSSARRFDQTQQGRVTFEDVAGIDEAENELVEIVDFLRDPQKYTRLGGTAPKGVLLVGAPGTGKTLLARAVAGEAGVPFFSMSASEFVEMIVGVGAARVRDLFRQAREAAPSIIFIDELDAIGRARGSGAALGGHDEREQTLNQILTEMDGFDPREGIIVLAATNRADVLDAALLRPGRFDRRVVVQLPDRVGRAAILEVHTRKVPLAPDVSLPRIAAETPGLVGADLRNLVNEAALGAARKGADAVRAEDFAEALQKIMLGPVRHILLNPADRERTAYHESGHALLALLVPGSDPVHRVSIVPRGMALGATFQLPVDERTSYSEEYLRARITVTLGGRAAEQIVYGVVTTGAENDLQQVTEIARRMVLRWGMSEKLGPISFVARQDDGLPPAFQQQPYSEATSEMIDSEVRRIVEQSHRQAETLLAEHRAELERLARALLEAESLDEHEIRKVTGLTEPPAPT